MTSGVPTAPPEVSVIIPTRNRLGMLRQAVDCALAQRDVTVEVVVVDEGSSDGTPAWLAGIDDERVVVVRHDEPRKLPGARNAGLAKARGTYVAFLDDDDLWAPDKLKLQLAAMQSAGAGWSYAGCVHLDDQLRPVLIHRAPSAATIGEQLAERNAVPAGGSGVVAGRELVLEVGGFDERLNASEDWECWVRLAAASPAAEVDQALVGRRRHSGSMSYDLDRMLTASLDVADRHDGIDGAQSRSTEHAGDVTYLAKMARESGDWRGAARVLWLERRNPRTWLRAPRILLTPASAWRWLFQLRRDRVRWAQPLIDDLARFR